MLWLGANCIGGHVLHKEVYVYVLKWQQYQVNKVKCLNICCLLHPLEILEELPKMSHQYDDMWVVIDHLRKMCFFIPTKTTTIKTPNPTQLFIEHVQRLYGLLASIISDKDQKFDNYFLCAILQKIKNTY